MRSTAKILVMDDQPNTRHFLEKVLSQAEYQVVAVESEEAALATLTQQTFDLALLDLKLKGVGGMAVLAALRHQSPDTVVIILTAYASLETALEALRQGAHDYLLKPCQPAQLRESVRQGLLKRQQALQQRGLLSQLAQHMANDLENIRAITAQPAESAPALVEQPAPRQFAGAAAAESEPRILQWGKLTADLTGHVITLEGQRLELSPTEFDLLESFA